MNIYAISALVNVATSVVLGLLVLLSDKKSPTNRTFSIFAAAVAFWSYAYFSWQIQTDADSALWWTRILMAGAAVITPVYYHFSCYFLGIGKQQRIGIRAGYFFIFISLLVNQNPLYVRGVTSIDGFSFWPIPGPIFAPFLIIWLGYAIYPIFLFWRAMRRADPEQASAIRYIIAGTVIGYAGGCTNYFLWYGIHVPPFGNISASIYLALVAYAIMRHRLFNMKVIATELLVFLLWLAIFVRMLIATTFQDQIVDAAFLGIALIVGTLLIRSVDREVEQREEIERLSNEKSEFMSFASHEIRNPITAMRGYASLIQDGTAGEVSAEAKKLANRILVEGNNVLRLISEFLEKSKLELGKISYDHAAFDVGAVARAIGEGYRPHAEEKGLSLTINIPDHAFTVVGDEGKVREVLGNIIDNSLKYTREGGITVAVERHGVAVRCTVSDTGVGIKPEVLPHLFKKFSRADAQKVNLLGTGIGLYLAKTFIEGQGGRIWAESDGENKGSRFIIEFPAER